MAIPAEADQVVLHGYLIDEATGTGVDAEIVCEPVALAGQSAAPMVLSAVSHAYIQTRTRRTKPTTTTGYWAVMALSTNDPDVEAYGGRKVTLPGQAPRTVQVPYDAPQVTVSAAMAAQINPGNVAGKPVAGDTVRALWFDEAAGFTPPPAGAAWLNADQTVSTIVTAVEAHDGDPDAHQDIRDLIGSGGGASSLSELSDVDTTGAEVGRVVAVTGTSPLGYGHKALTYGDLSGTVPTAALPPLAINETFVVASQAAMLALTAQRGDMAVRTDLTPNRTFVLASDSPGTLADWKEVLAAGQVTSVAGKSGTVALVKADVGLGNVDDTSDADKPISTAQQAALDVKLDQSGGDPLILGVVSGLPTSSPLGPPGAALTGLRIRSSFAGGDDASGDTGAFDSTGRLLLESYQRANVHSYGEVARIFLRRSDAKAMIAWYGPKAGYNTDRTPAGTNDTTGAGWTPITWIGSHAEDNSHAAWHNHFEIEIPDSTGALQGRLEIPYAAQTTPYANGWNQQVGLDVTKMMTNLTHFVVRCSNGQQLRLTTGAGAEKPIVFANDTDATNIRWKIRQTGDAETGSSAGSDFEIVRYLDTAGTVGGTPLKIRRADGQVTVENLTVSGTLTTGGASSAPFARKTADTVVTSNATLANDPDLAVAVAANSTYVVDCDVIYDSATTADISFAWVGPSGTTLDWTTNALGSTATGGTGTVTVIRSPIGSGNPLGAGGVGVGSKVFARLHGLLVVGSTAGTLQLMWAQGTSDATNTTVRANSNLRLTKVA